MVEMSQSGRQQRGFTLIELLVVVAIIGIVSSIAIPQLMIGLRRARISRLVAELNGFQRALVEYSIDNSRFPLKSEFNKKTLEPLVSQGYLKVNTVTRLCRDDEIHSYDFEVSTGKDGKEGKKGKSLKWHCHPKLKPYDNGPQKVEIKGDGSTLVFKYMGQEMGPSQFLALVQ